MLPLRLSDRLLFRLIEVIWHWLVHILKIDAIPKSRPLCFNLELGRS